MARPRRSGGKTDVPCGDDLTVDPGTGNAWLPGEPVLLATPDGRLTPLDVDADLVVWDAASAAIYAARSGDDTVLALEDDGSHRWEAGVDGPIHALTHAGARSAAVVSWETREGRGTLTWLDGETGAPWASTDTPAPAPRLTSSANGRMLAVVLPEEAHFFRVD